ncbi:MAG: hypothetical protein ABUL44_01475, partial [Flavobacterium sp.]
MSVFVKQLDINGSEIYSNLPKDLNEYFSSCKVQNELIEHSPILKRKARHGILKNEFGTAYLLSDEPELVERPRYFKEKLKVHSEYLKELISIKENLIQTIQADNRRLVHNITSINAHNIQEIYLLVPEDKLSQDYRGILEII